MQTLIDFVKSITDVIAAVIDFVIGLFQDLIYMIQLLGQVLLNIPNYFMWLPAEALALIVLTIGVVVIYKILGREG